MGKCQNLEAELPSNLEESKVVFVVNERANSNVVTQLNWTLLKSTVVIDVA